MFDGLYQLRQTGLEVGKASMPVGVNRFQRLQKIQNMTEGFFRGKGRALRRELAPIFRCDVREKIVIQKLLRLRCKGESGLEACRQRLVTVL